MKGIKPNYAEIGRQYNCDPRTVKKYYEDNKTLKSDDISHIDVNLYTKKKV